MIDIQIQDSCEGFKKRYLQTKVWMLQVDREAVKDCAPRHPLQRDGLGWKPTQTRGSPTTDFTGPR